MIRLLLLAITNLVSFKMLFRPCSGLCELVANLACIVLTSVTYICTIAGLEMAKYACMIPLTIESTLLILVTTKLFFVWRHHQPFLVLFLFSVNTSARPGCGFAC